MFFFYQLVILFIITSSPIIIVYRIIKNKEDKYRFKEKFCFFSKKRNEGKLIWFHCASVGELMSIIPLLDYYEKNKSINQILVTSATVSSSEIFKKFNFKKTVHQFFPLDFVFFTHKFLNYWKPSLAIFVESEIWPSMFKVANKKKIPLILLNARITKKSFLRWYKFKNFAFSIFSKILSVYPQNIETLNFMKKLKVKNVKFIGNLKFIENINDKKNILDHKLNLQLKKLRLWVAASTHHQEEIICVKAHKILKKKFKNLLTIIIPRHIDRIDKISNDLKKFNLKIAYHSSKIKNLSNIDIYIIDTYGDSKKFYKISKTVLMGGSLVNKGGQNPLEAARLGAKILHGKNIKNFTDVYKFLKKLQISKLIYTPQDIADQIIFNKTKIVNIKLKKIGNNIFHQTTKEINKLIHNAN